MSEDKFEFKGEFLKELERSIAKYPEGRQQSAVLVALDQAQRQLHDQGHYVTDAAINCISRMLDMPPIRILEVASFFTMINLKPVGKHHIQLCGTISCQLRGAEEIRTAIEQHLDISNGDTTVDGEFTLTEVECLGACCNAPMVQINDDFHEDLTPEKMTNLIDELKAGRKVAAGSVIGRRNSEPEGGPETLLDAKALKQPQVAGN